VCLPIWFPFLSQLNWMNEAYRHINELATKVGQQRSLQWARVRFCSLVLFAPSRANHWVDWGEKREEQIWHQINWFNSQPVQSQLKSALTICQTFKEFSQNSELKFKEIAPACVRQQQVHSMVLADDLESCRHSFMAERSSCTLASWASEF